MTMLIHHGRRSGSSKSAEETSKLFQAPDLLQVKVLPRAEWLRIQDELNKVNKDKESIREAAKQREALHRQSKEVVKKWSNTIAGQRQKKLEAKNIREQVEEERRKQTDIEEAKYQEEKRKEVIEKAKSQLYYQTDRVRGLHSALLLTEVLKEREAQIELKERIKSSSKNVDKEYITVAKARDDEALRKDEEKKLEKKSERKAVAEAQKKQITQIDLTREQQKMETRNDAEKIQHLQALYQWEQKLEEEKLTEQKRNLMQAHLEHISNRNLIKSEKAKKQEEEDEKRKLFLSTKQKMMKMRKDKEAEIIRELQRHRERIMDRLTASQQEQTVSEEQRIAKAVAEQEAKRQRQWREEEERRAGMLKSITAHREMMRQEKEQRDKEMQQNAREMLHAIQEADRIFSDKQKLKSQKIREEHRKLQDFNATQMAARIARQQQLKKEDLGFEVKNRDLVAEEEKHFQQYSRHVISAAAEVQRNIIPLCKAAREGIGGGHGPVFGGLRPSYLVQDCSGAQMPTYVSTHTQNIKTLHDVSDVQGAKKRLGFIWAL